MAKDPAILFYTSDFLTGTILMTNEQKGKYITLLCIQHQKGELSEKDMLNICSSYDKEVFDKFTKTDTGYYNERMKYEHERRANFSKSRSENRLKGIENKKLKSKKKVKKSYDYHMENENENYVFIKDPFKNIMNEWFEYKKQRKEKYSSEKSIEQCYNKLVKLSNDNVIEATKIINEAMANNYAGFFELKKSKQEQQENKPFIVPSGKPAKV